jgi:CubicO group peptidase (beta-lactamase class C family)
MKSRLFISILLLNVSVFAQNAPTFIGDSLDVYIKNAMEGWQIPGMAVGIIKNGKVIHLKGYGVRALGQFDPIDENTLFMIGSNTKAFTATAMAMLQDDGKLSLDDKATKWLPMFKMTDPSVSEQVIIRDLLSHRLGYETFQGDFVHYGSNLSRAEIVNQFSKMPLYYPFRTTWGYCNAAFTAAGEIIPIANNGMTWETYIKDRLFTPLSMTRSLTTANALQSATNAAAAHTFSKNVLVKIPYAALDNIAPAGSISSSVSDMMHWVQMQLDSGKYEGKQIVSPKAVQETHFPHAILGNVTKKNRHANFQLYGLGWFLMDYEGRKMVVHEGGVDGFVTSVTLLPKEKLGIVVLTNTDQNALYDALRWTIVDAFLGMRDMDYSDIYLQQYRNQMDEDKKQRLEWDNRLSKMPQAELPLESYVGTFYNEIYGNVNVTMDDKKLILHLSRHPNMVGTMECLGKNQFLCSYSNPVFGVKINEFKVKNGAVKALTVRVADFVDFLPYEFLKK